RGRRAANLVALPPTGDLRNDLALDFESFRAGQWNMIEFFEQLGDMLPLPKDSAPRNLRGMRCENSDHSNALQRPEGVFKTDAGIADAKQRPQKCAGLRRTG